MILGHILQPGETLEATDLRVFGEAEGELKHIPCGQPMHPVGVAGGVVTAAHGHFFRRWKKPEGPDPELEAAKAEIANAQKVIHVLQKERDDAQTKNVSLVASNAELRSMNSQLIAGRGIALVPAEGKGHVADAAGSDGPTLPHLSPVGGEAPPEPAAEAPPTEPT